MADHQGGKGVLGSLARGLAALLRPVAAVVLFTGALGSADAA